MVYQHFIKTITLDLMPQKIYFLRLLVSDIQYCTVCPKNKKVPFLKANFTEYSRFISLLKAKKKYLVFGLLFFVYEDYLLTVF